jgi:hypothetical protein
MYICTFFHLIIKRKCKYAYQHVELDLQFHKYVVRYVLKKVMLQTRLEQQFVFNFIRTEACAPSISFSSQCETVCYIIVRRICNLMRKLFTNVFWFKCLPRYICTEKGFNNVKAAILSFQCHSVVLPLHKKQPQMEVNFCRQFSCSNFLPNWFFFHFLSLLANFDQR